jgi:glycosyltransferase involved in cell wall biosynthesis
VQPVRFAFLTPTFVTEPNSGGMGTYLHRLTRALRELGHEPEVFTLSQATPGPTALDGVHVERVSPPRNLPLRAIARLSRLTRATDLGDVTERVRGALGLARAFRRRDHERPFHALQSSDYGLAGLFIGSHPTRPHLVRCSWAADLFIAADGNLHKLDSRLYSRLDRHCVRKADIAYAPSRFVATYYRDRHGLEVKVLRPPFMLETGIASPVPWELPRRYFMYFGAICPRKGTDVLAAALPLVWRQEPDFTMVWAGEAWDGGLDGYRRIWGDRASQVMWLGYISKPEVYAVLRGAEASVAPSRVDNLPNTVIESLLFNVPVIGSRGASIDELIEPGTNGTLVPIGQPAALAEALVSAWRREVPWAGGRVPLPAVIEQMEPRAAAVNLLRLAGCPG